MEPQKEMNKAINKGQNALNQGFDAAESRIDKAKDSLNANTAHLRDRAVEISDEVMSRLGDAQEATTEFVKKYPIGAIAGAVGVGLLAGWVLHASTRTSRH